MTFPNPKSKIQNPKSKSGFTLVELLVTITIITMLAGLVLGGLTLARNAAREMKTKATIAKLDEIVLRMYAGYAYRRVPISISGLNQVEAAQTRLFFVRWMLRWDMPDRYEEVHAPAQTSNDVTMKPTALSEAYRLFMPADPGMNASAACLYMIIALSQPRELANFGPDEMGRVPVGNTTLPVFVDAWGNPIRFLRWPLEFPDSDIQPPPGVGPDDPGFVRDPFDTRPVDTVRKVLPLVYSAGLSGRYGIDRTTGMPDGTGDHFDNIHNHRLEIR